MNERLQFLNHKLPYLFAGVIAVVGSLFLVLFVQGCVKAASTLNDATGTSFELAPSSTSDSPNTIAVDMEQAMAATGKSMGEIDIIAQEGLRYVTATTSENSKAVTTSAGTAVRGIGNGIITTATTVANGVAFVLQLPLKLFGLVSSAPVISSVIEPADHSHVPIISADAPELRAAQQTLSPAQTQPATTPAPELVWPMHGQITTHFGEGGRFYRIAHTGIDISDGQPSGVTPIKAFRQGKVTAAGQEGGLGNRVVIDHGNNITSVYGHLSSISVKVGDAVDTKTTLGFQGSTGISTGPHLHFEIRVNNQAANPRLFIAGLP